MAIRVISRQVGMETVTPEQADSWLRDHFYKYQRSLRQYHVDELALAIRREELEPPPQVCLHSVNGSCYLTNGQHSLSAVVKVGKPVDLIVYRAQVEREEDVSRSYGNTDRCLIRTIADALATYDFPARTGLTKVEINSLASAMVLIVGGFDEAVKSTSAFRRNHNLRVDAIEEWITPSTGYYAAIRDSAPSVRMALRWQGVAAIGLVTFNYQPEKATEFWGPVSANADLSPETGPWVLVNHILFGSDYRLPGARRARRTAACWNAFFEGRPLLQARGAKSSLPIHISGTPYSREGSPIRLFSPDEGVLIGKMENLQSGLTQGRGRPRKGLAR